MPRLNSFSIIGVILIGVAIYALGKGVGFEFDPGVPSERGEPVFYLIVGVLMLVNGLVLPRQTADDEEAEQDGDSGRPANERTADGRGQAKAAAVSSGRPPK